MRVSDREFVFTGADRGKLKFFANAMRAARRRPKLVLAAHPNLAPLVPHMRLLASKMKSIVCTHGVEVWEPLPARRRNALTRATLVLSPSRATSEYLINVQGVAEDRIRVLPWALDPDFATKTDGAPRAPLPGEFPPGRVILSVGRWLASERYKGMDTLILSMSRLLLRWPDLQLAIVGSGDDRDWLEHVARDSGVQRHVHFLTGISYGELSACYEAAEIFALPSRGEGFGFVYLEAMAHGKPVIGGAHGGAPEVIRDGVTGYVVHHGDTVELATSIDTLLSNPENVTVLTADWGLERRLAELPGEPPAENSPFGQKREVQGVKAIYLANWFHYHAISWNPALQRYLRARLQNFDVVHIFGLYDLLGPHTARAAQKRNIPYVVEPIGMFVPIVRNLFLKRVYHRFFGAEMPPSSPPPSRKNPN
jgi:phosphatidylinositol alpha-1,6-mannosyltransferase